MSERRMRNIPPAVRPRFLSEADCHEIAQRLQRAAQGGGDTAVTIMSRWTGNVRWARNQVSTTEEDRNNHIEVIRSLQGYVGRVTINEVSDEALVAAARRAERLAHRAVERREYELTVRPGSPFHYQEEPFTAPQLFFEATYQLDAKRRAAAARTLAQSAAAAGMLSAGYIEVSATSKASIASWGYTSYYQYTWAQYSVTVRDPKGQGSGWAGVDWPDWSKINGEQLSAIALDKCLKSRNPVAVEPGRYTTILEPQAVCDFVGQWGGQSDRQGNEIQPGTPFHKSGSNEPPNIERSQLALSRLGEKVIDERITISADPMDPELGFPPYQKKPFEVVRARVIHPVTWIEHGVLKTLAYDHEYAVTELGRNTGLPASGAFRMSGGDTSMEEMIDSTKRGLLVTRFDQVEGPSGPALLCRGYTRDGFWLVENGKISKPIKNMLFVESILFALNNVEQLGPPQRAFRPVTGGFFENVYLDPQPVIVPPIKVRDFSFTALTDAV